MWWLPSTESDDCDLLKDYRSWTDTGLAAAIEETREQLDEDLREDERVLSDTNFLLDYLDEDRPASEDAKALLEANSDRDYRIPSIAFFEVLRGGVRLHGAAGVADLIEQLSWADHLPLTSRSAREAALINGEFEQAGQKINLGDVLIAGTVREAGGTIVTCDSHFEHVDDLDVKIY